MRERGMLIKTLLLDIDGIVNNKGSLIPGINELLQRIVDKGIKIKFVTNCSLHKIYHLGEKILPGYKLEIVDPIDVLMSLATKDPSLYQCQTLVIGTKDIRKRISDSGIKISENKSVENVFIFEKLNYDQEELVFASRSVLNGARLYCAGIDRLFWYQGNVYPGVGAITEQVKFMTQAEAFILGKPSRLIFELAMHQVPDLNHTVFVGDDFHIDILGAKNCGLMTAYLTIEPLSKVSRYMPQADLIDVDFKSFAEKILQEKKHV